MSTNQPLPKEDEFDGGKWYMAFVIRQYSDCTIHKMHLYISWAHHFSLWCTDTYKLSEYHCLCLWHTYCLTQTLPLLCWCTVSVSVCLYIRWRVTGKRVTVNVHLPKLSVSVSHGFLCSPEAREVGPGFKRKERPFWKKRKMGRQKKNDSKGEREREKKKMSKLLRAMLQKTLFFL